VYASVRENCWQPVSGSVQSDIHEPTMLKPFLFSSGRRRETSNCSRGKRACSVLKNVGLAVVGLVTAAANKPNVRHTLVPESIPFLLRCLSLMTSNIPPETARVGKITGLDRKPLLIASKANVAGPKGGGQFARRARHPCCHLHFQFQGLAHLLLVNHLLYRQPHLD
jgi:hypothetical protein